MIKNFSDLSANERTYLSWIRTAIAMMAFGFLIEKFELFLRVIAAEVHTQQHLHSSVTIETVGILMMVISVMIMIGSSVRYLKQYNDISSSEEKKSAAGGIGFILALLMIMISLFLVIYIASRLTY